jgi:cysteine desulfurase
MLAEKCRAQIRDSSGSVMAPIYLDHQATTPLDADVLAEMMPYLTGIHGNPHSTTHRAGREAKAGVDIARQKVAALIGVAPAEIIFTSGATESNNLALRGVMESAPSSRNRLVTVATEHGCVLETAMDLQARGFALTVLPVQKNGLLDMEVLEKALGDDVALVSVMTVNNEIGVIQPIEAIARRTRGAGALFHTDAAQAFGKMPLTAAHDLFDLMSVSAHKIYGPKGIGALHVRSGIKLRPQMTGGGQEAGVRSGTLSPALCAGFGAAAQMAQANMMDDIRQSQELFNQARAMLAKSGVRYFVNGDPTRRLVSNLSVTFPGADGARLISDARGVMMSSGSACASQPGKLSHVLAALGLDDANIKSTIRLGFGRGTTSTDITTAMTIILDTVRAQTDSLGEKCA